LHGINTRLREEGGQKEVLHMQHTLVGHPKMMTLLTATAITTRKLYKIIMQGRQLASWPHNSGRRDKAKHQQNQKQNQKQKHQLMATYT